MQAFCRLLDDLEAERSGQAQVHALRTYLQAVPADDAAWGLHLLMGGRWPRAMPLARLRQIGEQATGLPDWLFQAGEAATGDLCEALALLLPAARHASPPGLADWMGQRVLPLRGLASDHQATCLMAWWDELDAAGRWCLNRLVTGGWRSPVLREWVVRALAEHLGHDPRALAVQLAAAPRADGGDGRAPAPAALRALLAAAPATDIDTRWGACLPWPFQQWQAWRGRLAPPLPSGVSDWLATGWHGGLEAQLLRRDGRVWIWSRTQGLLDGRLPELERWAQALPEGTVIEGELLVGPSGAEAATAPIPPGAAQRLLKRLQRGVPGPAALRADPAVFVAHDLLAWHGQDLRTQPLSDRLAALRAHLGAGPIRCAPAMPAATADDWQAWWTQARSQAFAGLCLRPHDAAQADGSDPAASPPGAWIWHAPAHRLLAVLVYVPARNEAGHASKDPEQGLGFAVWNDAPRDVEQIQSAVAAIVRREPPQADGLQLVTCARVARVGHRGAPGPSAQERAVIDALCEQARHAALERFGPVQAVEPRWVVELAVDAVRPSRRHKCGLALDGVTVVGLRPDVGLHHVATLSDLQAWLVRHPVDR